MLCMDYLRTLFFILLVKMVNCSYRKILDGRFITHSKRYMVYLLKAEKSPMEYETWICGGAIVSPDFIVTSAACVKDIQYMYAIAGYKKYVNIKNLPQDQCASKSKKKIVFVCVPRGYDLDYARVEKWSYIDIAVAQVEEPYDFSAPTLPGCTWTPDKIAINYNKKYQLPKTDAMVLGWGHTKKYRKPDDRNDYNQHELRYSSIQILNKPECKKMYRTTPALLPVIDKYMICALYDGRLDDRGDTLYDFNRTLVDGCPHDMRRIGDECEVFGPSNPYDYQDQENPPSYDFVDVPNANEHKNRPAVANQKQKADVPDDYNEEITFDDLIKETRRSDKNLAKTNSMNDTSYRKAGICQNDHGGPLVTWVGTVKRLIGVASVFRLDKKLSCVGPYLFTSTQCNGAFLDCVINGYYKDEEDDSETTTTVKATTKTSTTTKKTETTTERTTTTTTEETTTTSTKTTSTKTLPDFDQVFTNNTQSPTGNNTQFRTMQGKVYELEDYDYNVGSVESEGFRRSSYCSRPPKKRGFDVFRRRISWKDHPDGPAVNERR